MTQPKRMLLPNAPRGALHPVKAAGTVAASSGLALVATETIAQVAGASVAPYAPLLIPLITGLLSSVGTTARNHAAGGGSAAWRLLAWL